MTKATSRTVMRQIRDRVAKPPPVPMEESRAVLNSLGRFHRRLLSYERWAKNHKEGIC